MKRFALKPLLAMASVAAFLAVAMPATASAVVWGPVGTSQSLDSSAVSYQTSSFAWTCTNVHYGVGVRKPASSTLDVTAFSSSGCVGALGALYGCTISQSAVGLPWTVTAPVSTSNVRTNVGGIKAAVSGSCLYSGLEFTYSGELAGGVWNAAGHSLAYSSATGLKIAGAGAMTVTGTWKDPKGLLTLS